jgi:hypothetical protein
MDRRSAACTVHVQRGDGEAHGFNASQGVGRPGKGATSVGGGLGRRTGADVEAARARRRGAKRGWLKIVLLCPSLNMNNSKNLY